MSATDSRYEVKAFLYRLSQKLTKEQSNALVIIYELPAAMRDQSPFDVIVQLEMQRKFTTLEELAGMLKSICRYDLAKEVTTFAKKKKTYSASPELFRPPQWHYDAQRNLECDLQVTKLQFTILQEQMKKLREAAAIEPGHKRIEQRAQNELKSASDKLFKELQYISTLLHTQKSKDDGTGDSGFAEASQFIKPEPTQKPTLPQVETEPHKLKAGYRRLTMSTQRPHVDYYKTGAHKGTLSEATYDTTKNCLRESANPNGTDPVYVNVKPQTGDRK